MVSRSREKKYDEQQTPIRLLILLDSSMGSNSSNNWYLVLGIVPIVVAVAVIIIDPG